MIDTLLESIKWPAIILAIGKLVRILSEESRKSELIARYLRDKGKVEKLIRPMVERDKNSLVNINVEVFKRNGDNDDTK